MNSNQTVLEALANEGIVTTEEALLRAVEDGQTISGLGASAHGLRSINDLVVIARPPLAEEESNGPLPVQLADLGETNGAIGLGAEAVDPLAGIGTAGVEPVPEANGVWRRTCAFVGRGICRIGIHAARWVYLQIGECNQLRDCLRCGTAKTRVKHRRHWQYTDPKTCRQMKVCSRCDHRENSRTVHQAWSESWPAGADQESHKCKRCGVVETFNVSCGD